MSRQHAFMDSLTRSDWSTYESVMSLATYFGPYHLSTFPEGSNAFQTAGIDAALFYDIDKIALVDFKLDSYDSQRLAIEIISNDKTGKPGWAVDPTKRNDWHIYHFSKTGETFLLPRVQLALWLKTHDAKIRNLCETQTDGFKLITAKNRTYQTICYGIPPAVLTSIFGRAIQTSYKTITLGDKK